MEDPVTIYEFFAAVLFLTIFFAEYSFFAWMIEHWSERTKSPVSGAVVGIYLVWFMSVLQTFISFGLTTVTVGGITIP
jgi:hypothetical protein